MGVDRLTSRHAIATCGLLVALTPAVAAANARVVGRVVGADGKPAAGAKVRVTQTDTGIWIPLFAPTGPTRVVTDTVAGADGRYSSPLPDAYVAGTETDTDWIVSASKPAEPGQRSGPVSSLEFEVNTALQEAPDLPLWESTPTISLDGYRATVRLSEQPPQGDPYVFLGPERVKGTSASFDLRLQEPASGTTLREESIQARGVAYADVRVGHREGRTIYHLALASPTVAPATLPALVPPSRGSPCKLTSADGRVTDAQPCLATDGKFIAAVSQPSTTSTTTAAGVTSVTVELVSPVDVESVFVRGCDGTCVVEVSADGATWARSTDVQVDRPNSEIIAVARFPTVPGARAVRVSRPGGTLSLTELSAWPARPAGSPAPAASVAQPPDVRPEKIPVGAAVAAALLLGAVATGMVVVAATRRST
jgi:hypothetical protein